MLTAALQLSKRRSQDAREVAALNKSRAEEVEKLPNENKEQITENKDRHFSHQTKRGGSPYPLWRRKNDYESWKAAFLSAVDRLDIPVGEKFIDYKAVCRVKL